MPATDRRRRGAMLDRLLQHGRRCLRDRRPAQLRPDPPCLRAGRRELLRLLDVAADGLGQRGRIGERHDRAGTRAEHVLGIPVRGRHDAAAGGEAERERSRRDLLALPVRSDEDVGLGEEVGDLLDVEEAVVEFHVILEAQVEHRLLERQPVALALAVRDVGMRAPRDHVEHLWMALHDRRQRRDRRLEALPGGDQPERREQKPLPVGAVLRGRCDAATCGTSRRIGVGALGEHRRCAVGNDANLALGTGAAVDEEAARRVRHDDHELGLTAHAQQ